MFGFLLRKLRPLQAEDVFFGRLVYMKMPGDQGSYWEARRKFGTSGQEIELFIDAPAPKQPPAERQRDFFTTVERDYARILEAVDPVLRSEFYGWTGEPLSGPIEETFELESFSIPDATIEEAEWEISYETTGGAKALFSVQLTGLTPTSITVDD